MPADTPAPRPSRVSQGDLGIGRDTIDSVSASSPLLTPPRKGAVTGRALILLVVVAVLAITLAVPVKTWFAQRAQIAGLQADVSAAKAQVASLQSQAHQWADPNFVAAQARQRLHFVLPGEVGYVAVGVNGQPVSPATATTLVPTSWFDKLWSSVQQADHGSPTQ